jgi:dTDP-4-amino-4,6-dideoxygalactose transaminase
MCATATSILHWNAIPIFADIEKDTFCIDPVSIRKNITKKTKAIISVDIAGQSANIDELNKIAKEYNLKIISDTAQAPGAKYKEKFAGTLTDIGGFSLNYHKHIHTGEGGVLVTNDNKLAERMCLIRNHGEAVVEKKKSKQINNILGFNFRMGEIECAIAFQQLKKLKKNIRSRQNIAKQFDRSLSNFSGIQIPKIREGCSHVYYVYQMQIDKNFIGVHRNVILKALQAEGIENLSGNFANLHLLPMYQKKVAYGKKGFPWSFSETRKNINYNKGICPIAEKLNDETYLGFEMCTSEMQVVDINNVINAFDKVWNNLDSLRIKFKG